MAKKTVQTDSAVTIYENGETREVPVPVLKVPKTIQVPCMRFKQGTHTLYSFVIDGKQLHYVATVPHVSRDEHGVLTGIQRKEVDKHIATIAGYLNANKEDAMIPNSLILGFNKPSGKSDYPKFAPYNKEDKDCPFGTLTLSTDDMKHAILVDGQQRDRAIRDSEIEEFPVNVVAFVAETPDEFLEHTVRINSTKAFPKSLIYEMLPRIGGSFSTALEKKRIPSKLVERLNNDEDSPLVNLIKTITNESGNDKIAMLAFMTMLEKSLKDGYLSELKEADDIDGMVDVVKNFWSAARDTFDKEWILSTKECRFFHAASVRALGAVMDKVSNLKPKESLTKDFYSEIFQTLKPHCAWTPDAGEWNLPVGIAGGGRKAWNEIQNTGPGVNILTHHFMKVLRESNAVG